MSVEPLDAFLVASAGFGVVVARRETWCFVRMQNGVEGVVPAGLLPEMKRQLELLVGGGGERAPCEWMEALAFVAVLGFVAWCCWRLGDVITVLVGAAVDR